jgi:hypothetical protein
MLKKLSVVTFDAFLSVAGTPPTRRSYLLPKAPWSSCGMTIASIATDAFEMGIKVKDSLRAKLYP